MCNLRIDERISFQEIANRFHAMFPGRPKPSAMGVKKMYDKLHGTGSVFNRPKSGRPRTATDENNEIMVLASVSFKMQQSVREIAMETANSLTSAWRILKRHKFHPYGVTLVQELSERDFELREDFCVIMEHRLRDPTFIRRICFSDESTFHRNGFVNRHNCRYWSQENPHEYRESHSQTPEKLNVWSGILGNTVIGPFFIEGNLNGEKYLDLLVNDIVPAMRVAAAAQNIPWTDVYFQQDGAPPHYSLLVRAYLNTTFPNRWIGRLGPIRWPPRSPDLTPLDFFLWGYVKERVFRTTVDNLHELRNRIIENCLLPDDEMLERVRESFIHRIFMCLSQRGAHFEHLL